MKKCDVVMKLSVFGTRTDTHTHKAKPIHPRYAGCKTRSFWICPSQPVLKKLKLTQQKQPFIRNTTVL